jgi:hypothetical protein
MKIFELRRIMTLVQGVESVGSGRFYASDRSDRLHIGPKIKTDRSGILRSVLGEIKTDPTEFYLGYPIGPKGETGKGEQK